MVKSTPADKSKKVIKDDVSYSIEDLRWLYNTMREDNKKMAKQLKAKKRIIARQKKQTEQIIFECIAQSLRLIDLHDSAISIANQQLGISSVYQIETEASSPPPLSQFDITNQILEHPAEIQMNEINADVFQHELVSSRRLRRIVMELEDM